jgi:hypothetical protein
MVTRRGGLTRIGPPPLTPWNGPYFASRDVKTATRIHNESEWAEALAEQLPPADAAIIQCPAEVLNMSGFIALGYDLAASYTYRIALGKTREALWEALLPRTRQNIRKAEKLVNIVIDIHGDRVASMVMKSFGRQNIDVGVWRALIGRIVETFQPSGHAHAYVAVDRDGKDHAAVLCVGDSRSTLYICGGADPTLRSSNAQSLLLWHAILQANDHSAVFDFCGSMKPSIAKHFRSFGAELHIKLGVTRINARYRALGGAFFAMRSVVGSAQALIRR